MKILVFTDTHTHTESLLEIKKHAKEVDFIICLGDITWFGGGMHEMLDIISTFENDVLMMHGNHEHAPELAAACEQYSTIHFSHEEIIHMNGFSFVTYGGGGFARHDPEFEEFMKQVKLSVQDKDKTIQLWHQPPYNTTTDVPFEDYHAGSVSMRNYIDTEQPLLVLVGHIHESFGQKDKIKNTTVLNPGIFGAIIDLEKVYEDRNASDISSGITVLGEENYKGVHFH